MRSVTLEQCSNRHCVLVSSAEQMRLLKTSWRALPSTKKTRQEPLWYTYTQWLTHHYLLSKKTNRSVLNHYSQLQIWQKAVMMVDACHQDDALTQAKTCFRDYKRALHEQEGCAVFAHTRYHGVYQELLDKHLAIDHMMLEQTFASWYDDSEKNIVVWAGFFEQSKPFKRVRDHAMGVGVSCCRFISHVSEQSIATPDCLVCPTPDDMHEWAASAILDHLSKGRTLAVICQSKTTRMLTLQRLCFQAKQRCDPSAWQLAYRALYDATSPMDRSVGSFFRDFCWQLTLKADAYAHILAHRIWCVHRSSAADNGTPGHIVEVDEDRARVCIQRMQQLIADSSCTFLQWSAAILECLRALGWQQLLLDQYQWSDWQVWQRAMQYALPPYSYHSDTMNFTTWQCYVFQCVQESSTIIQDSPLMFLLWQHAMDMPIDVCLQIDHNAATWPCSDLMDTPFTQCQDIQAAITASVYHGVVYAMMDAQGQTHTASHLFAVDGWRSYTPKKMPLHLCRVEPMPSDASWASQLPTRSLHSGLLQTTSDCPAQAFIRYRLSLRPDQTTLCMGLDANALGMLLHALLSDAHMQTASQPIPRDWLHLQLGALHLHLENWHITALSTYLEKQRMIWNDYQQSHLLDTMQALPVRSEHEITVEQVIAGHTFTMRLDRVDTFADGTTHIIDYKLGVAEKSQWFQNPIASIQMPLYALAYPNCAGIHFARLHPDRYGFQGASYYARYPSTTLFETKEAWEHQRTRWEEQVIHYANVFLQAITTPAPRQAETTCASCSFTMLCRRFDRSTTMDA